MAWRKFFYRFYPPQKGFVKRDSFSCLWSGAMYALYISQEDIMLEVTWYLVSDASRAFLFRRAQHSQPPTLVKEFSHAKSRAHDHELVSDRQGRSQNDASGGGYSVSLSEKKSPKEIEADVFARELSHYLSGAHHRKEYQHLFLIAPPHFLGTLRGELNQSVTSSILSSLDKDLSNLPIHEMAHRLQELQ
jgi:protein required for attachment to host cells